LEGVVELPGFVNVSEVLRSGVYALVYRGEVVYIGQSRAMIVRVYSHRSLARRQAPPWSPIKGVVFDEVHVMPCPVAQLDELEYDLINLYKPRGNTNLKHRLPSTREVTLTTASGVSVTLNAKSTMRIERRI